MHANQHRVESTSLRLESEERSAFLGRQISFTSTVQEMDMYPCNSVPSYSDALKKAFSSPRYGTPKPLQRAKGEVIVRTTTAF